MGVPVGVPAPNDKALENKEDIVDEKDEVAHLKEEMEDENDEIKRLKEKMEDEVALLKEEMEDENDEIERLKEKMEDEVESGISFRTCDEMYDSGYNESDYYLIDFSFEFGGDFCIVIPSKCLQCCK